MFRTILNLIIAIPLILVFCHGCSTVQKKRNKPNVIVIHTDDLGYGDVSCYNPQSKIQTPHIDKLATDGMLFTDAHSAASYCTPSRYSILTGNYCWREPDALTLQGGYGGPIIADEEKTLGHLFQENGYKTAAVGKWHVGMKWALKEGEDEPEEGNIDFESPLVYTPIDQGFDYFFGTSGCTSDDSPFAFIENRQLLGLPLTPVNDLQVVGDFNWDTGEKYYKDVLVAQGWQHETADTIFNEKAIEFIEREAKKDNPFFVYLAPSLPHIPWLPPDFIKGASQAGARGDQVALIDYCLGQITAKLDELGLEENTIIVFTSDNGPRIGENGHQSSAHLRGYKGSTFEGGHRVPFIVKWPGKIPANSKTDQLLGTVDLYGTFAKILNHTMGHHEAPDSFDFTSVFLGQAQNPVRETYVHHGFAIRKGDWKLIFDVEGLEDVSAKNVMPEGLYNLKNDPKEEHNLLAKHPGVAKQLKETFIDIYKKGFSRRQQ